MKNIIKIGNRKIGEKFKPFIICELGINHNGSLKLAKKMVDLAIKSGADAIKLQTYTADTLTLDYKSKDFYINKGPWNGQYMHDLYKEAYTPWEWHGQLFELADKIGISIFSSPFDFLLVLLSFFQLQ